MANDDYVALTTVHLPFSEKRVVEGDKITSADLEAAQQTDEDVKLLLDAGAIVHVDNYDHQAVQSQKETDAKLAKAAALEAEAAAIREEATGAGSE